jgi:hypothetical protein
MRGQIDHGDGDVCIAADAYLVPAKVFFNAFLGGFPSSFSCRIAFGMASSTSWRAIATANRNGAGI